MELATIKNELKRKQRENKSDWDRRERTMQENILHCFYRTHSNNGMKRLLQIRAITPPITSA